jgi:hypothetical protein
LNDTIEHGLITYKGLAAPEICDFLSREHSRQYYTARSELEIRKTENEKSRSGRLKIARQFTAGSKVRDYNK